MAYNRKKSDASYCFVFQKFYSQTLTFQLVRSTQKLTLLAQGQGLEPRLEFSPSILELGPLLPYAPGDEAEVVVKNPCDFPIEFYSLEFDQQYLVEEKVSRGPNQSSFSYPCWPLTFTSPSLWTPPCQLKDHFVNFSNLLPLPWAEFITSLWSHHVFKQPIGKLIHANGKNSNSEECMQPSLYLKEFLVDSI